MDCCYCCNYYCCRCSWCSKIQKILINSLNHFYFISSLVSLTLSLNQTFNAKNSFYKNNWFARQQSRRNHPTMVLSGILINFEHLFDVLFFGFSSLFLFTMELVKQHFVIVALFVVYVVIKIIKNRKAIK